MKSCSGERNSDKTDLKLRLKFTLNVCSKRAMCNYEIWNHQKACGTRESRSLLTLIGTLVESEFGNDLLLIW